MIRGEQKIGEVAIVKGLKSHTGDGYPIENATGPGEICHNVYVALDIIRNQGTDFAGQSESGHLL
jgi:hypothetical protein